MRNTVCRRFYGWYTYVDMGAGLDKLPVYGLLTITTSEPFHTAFTQPTIVAGGGVPVVGKFDHPEERLNWIPRSVGYAVLPPKAG